MSSSASALERFVDAWGEMGRIWGIPPTTARIQALLLVTEGPLSLDDIAERLDISKGGASTRLKELRSWRVAKRVAVSGDRRDHYVAEGDVWRMFLTMVELRKTREFDPLALELRRDLAVLRSQGPPEVGRRLVEMEDILDTMDGLGRRLLRSGPATRAVLRFLAGSRPSRKEK